MGHALMENRNGLVVDACLTEANGHAERIAALHMIEPRADRPRPITLGADKAYDAEDFVNELRSMNATPHVAQNTSGRSSAIDGRTTRHAGYGVSQRIRKRIEEAFGWIKTVAGQDRTKFRGRERVGWAFIFAATAYNLVRLIAKAEFVSQDTADTEDNDLPMRSRAFEEFVHAQHASQLHQKLRGREIGSASDLCTRTSGYTTTGDSDDRFQPNRGVEGPWPATSGKYRKQRLSFDPRSNPVRLRRAARPPAAALNSTRPFPARTPSRRRG